MILFFNVFSHSSRNAQHPVWLKGLWIIGREFLDLIASYSLICSPCLHVRCVDIMHTLALRSQHQLHTKECGTALLIPRISNEKVVLTQERQYYKKCWIWIWCVWKMIENCFSRELDCYQILKDNDQVWTLVLGTCIFGKNQTICLYYKASMTVEIWISSTKCSIFELP